MLQQLLHWRRGGKLLLLYGRRRVGKTALLRQWASRSNIPQTYWMAQKESAELQRRCLAAVLRGRSPSATGISFPSWSDLWDTVAELVRDDQRLPVLDELPWAIDADLALLSVLQFFPTWTPDAQLAACAMLGGEPQ